MPSSSGQSPRMTARGVGTVSPAGVSECCDAYGGYPSSPRSSSSASSRGSADVSANSRHVADGIRKLSKSPKRRRRSGSLPPGRVMLVSDEAPEATCLRNYVAPSGASFGVLSRCMRLSGKAATGVVTILRSRRSTGRRVRLRHHCEMTLQPGRWPGRFPPDGAPFRPGPSPGGCWPWSFATSVLIPAVCFAPPPGIFATARAPCLCASEARPSDRGIRLRGIRPRHLRIHPTSGGRPLQRAGILHLRQCSLPRRPRLA